MFDSHSVTPPPAAVHVSAPGSTPPALLSSEADQFTFPAKAIGRKRKRKNAVTVYCLLIVLLMLNSCWLINGDTIQTETYSVTQMDPGGFKRPHGGEHNDYKMLISDFSQMMKNETEPYV